MGGVALRGRIGGGGGRSIVYTTRRAIMRSIVYTTIQSIYAYCPLGTVALLRDAIGSCCRLGTAAYWQHGSDVGVDCAE